MIYDGERVRRRRETYLKTFLEDLDFAELTRNQREGAVSGAEGKIQLLRDGRNRLVDGIGRTSMKKIGQWLCDALLYEIKTAKQFWRRWCCLQWVFPCLRISREPLRKIMFPTSGFCWSTAFQCCWQSLLKSMNGSGTPNGSIDFMKALIPAFGHQHGIFRGGELRRLFISWRFWSSGGVAFSFGAASLHPCVCADGAVQSLF